MSITSIEKHARTQEVELPELAPTGIGGASVLAQNTALLDSVKVRLSVIVGAVETTLGELMALKESAVLTMDRLVDQPVDVVINGQVVARGALVAVDDNFGVRITEVAQKQA